MPLRVLLQSRSGEFVVPNSDTYVRENDANYVKRKHPFMVCGVLSYSR